MSKKAVLLVVTISIIVGVVIGYMNAVPNDFVKTTPDGLVIEEYGYRCGDGSEFTLVPSSDMSTIDIVPATSVDYVRKTTLASTTDGTGIHYRGGDISIRTSASGLMLIVTGHATTTCSSMLPANESLF